MWGWASRLGFAGLGLAGRAGAGWLGRGLAWIGIGLDFLHTFYETSKLMKLQFEANVTQCLFILFLSA